MKASGIRASGEHIRVDVTSRAGTVESRYTGSIRADTMVVKIAETEEVIGTFTLKRGNAGQVVKCL